MSRDSARSAAKPVVYLLPPPSRWDQNGSVNNSGLTSTRIGQYFAQVLYDRDDKRMDLDQPDFYVKGGHSFTTREFKRMLPIILVDNAELGPSTVREVEDVESNLRFRRKDVLIHKFSTLRTKGFELASKEKILNAIRGANCGVIFYGAFHTHRMAFYDPGDDFYIPVGQDYIMESELKDALKAVGGIFAADTCHAKAYESCRGNQKFELHTRDKPSLAMPVSCAMSTGLAELFRETKVSFQPQGRNSFPMSLSEPPRGPSRSAQDSEAEVLKKQLAELQTRFEQLTWENERNIATIREQAQKNEADKVALRAAFDAELEQKDAQHARQVEALQAQLAQALSEKSASDARHAALIREKDRMCAETVGQIRAQLEEATGETARLSEEFENLLRSLANVQNHTYRLWRQYTAACAKLKTRPDLPGLVENIQEQTLRNEFLEKQLRDTQSELEQANEFHKSVMDFVEQFERTLDASLASLDCASKANEGVSKVCNLVSSRFNADLENLTRHLRVLQDLVSTKCAENISTHATLMEEILNATQNLNRSICASGGNIPNSAAFFAGSLVSGKVAVTPALGGLARLREDFPMHHDASELAPEIAPEGASGRGSTEPEVSDTSSDRSVDPERSVRALKFQESSVDPEISVRALKTVASVPLAADGS